jgi:hypothetical protein
VIVAASQGGEIRAAQPDKELHAGERVIVLAPSARGSEPEPAGAPDGSTPGG